MSQVGPGDIVKDYNTLSFTIFIVACMVCLDSSEQFWCSSCQHKTFSSPVLKKKKAGFHHMPASLSLIVHFISAVSMFDRCGFWDISVGASLQSSVCSLWFAVDSPGITVE